MLKDYLQQLNAIIEREYAAQLSAAGFHPFKDYTEWLRLINDDILQIVLFCDSSTLGNLSLNWFSQPLSEYLRFDWRNQPDFENFVCNNFNNPTRRLGAPFYLFGGGIYNYPEALAERINDLHNYIDEMIITLDEIRSKKDIYEECVKYISTRPIHRPTLVFEAEEDEEIVFDMLGWANYIRKGQKTDEEIACQALKRDYRNVWRPMQSVMAKKAREEHDLNIYKVFTEKCIEYNLKYLKKRVPELWD